MPGNPIIFRPGALRGSVGVPGDKSISHRALIIGACCAQPLRIAGLNPGRDVRATREALRALGIAIEDDGSVVTVLPGRLQSPSTTLDCMNSGTTARMLLGACAGAGVRARFDGDGSLRRRPMEPACAQLRAFGAKIETTNGHLPARLDGTPQIETRHFILLSPSAQVKSALLLAGLYAGVEVRVDGDRGSRDHTERLLEYLGCEVERTARSVGLGTGKPTGGEIGVAGDFSAAAFFITAAALTPGSDLLVRDVGVNPTRTGLLEALRMMGAELRLRNERTRFGEPVADVAVVARPLVGAAIGPDVALRAIDEIPLLAIAAASAQGTTTISGVADLRSKESDRIAAIERLLGAAGAGVTYERGVLRIAGDARGGRDGLVTTGGDHRIAMAAAVLGCALGPITVDETASVAVSFPGFLERLGALRA